MSTDVKPWKSNWGLQEATEYSTSWYSRPWKLEDRGTMEDLAKKYQWVVNRLKEAFPEAEVISEVRDLGNAFAVALRFPLPKESGEFAPRTWATLIEYCCDRSPTGKSGLGLEADPHTALAEWIASIKSYRESL